jgi:hypothetical protein
MRKSKFSESQIVQTLKQAASGDMRQLLLDGTLRHHARFSAGSKVIGHRQRPAARAGGAATHPPGTSSRHR